MNDKEWEELLEARLQEVIWALTGFGLFGGYSIDECNKIAKELVGIKLDDAVFDEVGKRIFNRVGRGSFTLDETVTHLNNLQLGLHIADLQRAEVLEGDKQLAEAVELQQQTEKSLEQLCDEYEESVCTGKQSIEAQAYIMALEDLVSEMQGKSFTDSSKIGQLEAENAALRSYLKVEAGKEPVKPS